MIKYIKINKFISYVLLLSITFSMLEGCQTTKKLTEKNTRSIALMTDTGGINDQAFNQSAWEGAQKVKKDLDFDVKYIESKQVSDYKANIDALTDNDPDMIFVMGYTAADTLEEEANLNKNQHYVIIDYVYDQPIDNVLSIRFRDQEPAFLVGYIAGCVTKTNKLGFIGGAKCDTIDAFEYGYRAGVYKAAQELDKTIDVEVQYAENFQDDTKGKAMANTMYSKGVDVIYHAAGNLGRGVIEAAKENQKYVIGADRDQQYLAPKNVISSTLKLTGEVVYQICEDMSKIDDISSLTGKNKTVGLKENSVGISESTVKMIAPEVMYRITEIKNDIIDEKIIPPYNEDTFKEYIK